MTLKTDGLELLYVGKTKDVYAYGEEKVLLHAKDSVTGWKVKNPDGTTSVTIDPGANEVVGEVSGIGLKNIIASEHYFQLFHEQGIFTHYVDSSVADKAMLVRKATSVGHGLECIVRFKATGSIVRNYPDYVKEGQVLTDFFEMTTKHDKAGDPRISREFLIHPDFGPIMTEAQYEETKQLSLQAAKIVRDDLSTLGLELIDIKFEIGLIDGKIALIDEVSAGIMRVSKNGIPYSEEALADALVLHAKK